MKRIFDIAFSLVGLTLLLPLVVLISIIIMYKEGYPIFFIHKRIGKDFSDIYIYKFRTMSGSSDNSGLFDLSNKNRITSTGKILRKYKLDEIPQLMNVLKGDISFVGPRPEVESWVETFRSDWEEILRIRPGITDLASIKYSDEEVLLNQSEDPDLLYKKEILPKKLVLYKEYVDHNNLYIDLKIIMKTLIKVFIK